MKSIIFLSALSLGAANIPITLVSVTPQQAEIQYTSTISSYCTIAVTDNSLYGVTVWDVSSKFTNSNQDLSRPDTLVAPQGGLTGLARRALVGHRSAEVGTDGNIYSRSLQADAPHTLTVTCGSDSGSITFSTRTVPLGTAYPVLPPYCSGGINGHCDPTIDWTVGGKDTPYIDPLTGILVKRVTGPGEVQSSPGIEAAVPFAGAKDQSGSSAWSGINSALTYQGGTYATTTTNGTRTGNAVTNALFLAFGNYGSYNATGGYYPTFLGYEGGTIDDMMATLFVSGDPVSVCLTLDGQTCASPTITRTPSGTHTAIEFGDPSNTGSSTWPANPWTGPYNGWGSMNPLPPHLVAAAPISATVNGTAVAIAGLSHPNSDYAGLVFDVEVAAGSPLKIPTSTCTNSICTVASVTDTGHLTINESQSNLGTQTVQPMNAGILIWKASGSGTLSLNAQFGFAYSVQSSGVPPSGLLGNGGNGEQCGHAFTTTSFTSGGGALTTPHTGYLCQFTGGYGVYFWDRDAGSSRFIASNQYGSVYGSGGAVQLGTNPFDITSPNVWYTYAGSVGWGSQGGRFFIQNAYCLTTSAPCGNATPYARSPVTYPTTNLDSATTLFTTTYPYGITDLATPFATLLAGSFGGTLNPCPVASLGSTCTLGQVYTQGTSSTTTGTVNTSGTAVTWVSGVHFNNFGDNSWSGQTITIGGTGYTVSTVNSSTSLTLTTSAGSHTGSAYSITAAGLWGTFPLYVGNFIGTSSQYGFFVSKSVNQNVVAWIFPYDIVNHVFTGIINTYSGNPGCTGATTQNSVPYPFPCGSWASWHSAQPEGGGNYTWFYASSLPDEGNGGGNGAGPYVLPITQVWRSTDGINGSGSNGGWDTNTCEQDVSNSKGCGTTSPSANGGTVQYAYACPAGTAAYWFTTQQLANNIYAGSSLAPPSPYHDGNNCVQLMLSGPPCTLTPGTQTFYNAGTYPAEISFNPCPYATTTQAMLQDIKVGDTFQDGNDQSSSPELPCGNCETLTVVQVAAGAYPKAIWAYRMYNPNDGSFNSFQNSGGSVPGKAAHINGWAPRMINYVSAWFTDFSNPALWYTTTAIGSNHPTYGAASPTGLFGNYNAGNGQLGAQVLSNINTSFNLNTTSATGYSQAFNSTTAISPLIESYQSNTDHKGSANSQRFVSDYRTPQTGGATPGQLYSVTATLASGKSHIYDIGLVIANDLKNAPLYGVAGRWLLKDVSATGTMSDALNAGVFCVAYLANGCFAGDTQGHEYVNAPFIEPASGLPCWGQPWNFSSPCVAPAYGVWGQAMMKNAVDPDPAGQNFMRLTGLFNPPFLSPGYQVSKFSPDGQWLFYQSWNAGGYRGEVMAARVPNIAQDSNNRTTFVQIPMSPPAGSWLARFGYDANFHCQMASDANGNLISGYNDQCITVAAPTQSNPFNFSGEAAVSPSTCSGSSACFFIPAVSGRILYFRLERYVAGTLAQTGQTQRVAVP